MVKLFVIAFVFALAPVAALAQKPITTGSIKQDAPLIMHVSVIDAPGDGKVALADAIRKELAAISVFDRPGKSAYRLQVRVLVKKDLVDGKQPVAIEWEVYNPKGKRVGTVSQRVELDPGALDGPWGKYAVHAAGAAVRGIVKLLPQG